jgi:hypothetical protein
MLAHALAAAYPVVFVIGTFGVHLQASAQSASGNTGNTGLSQTAQNYQQMCNAAGGYFQTGTVNSKTNNDYPQVTNYTSGKKRQGIPLSHTHIEITSAIDGNIYDVAIDNVFATDYDPNSYVVPPSYVNGIQAGGNLYLCSGNPTKVPYTVSESVASAGFDWCIPTGSQRLFHFFQKRLYLQRSGRESDQQSDLLLLVAIQLF